MTNELLKVILWLLIWCRLFKIAELTGFWLFSLGLRDYVDTALLGSTLALWWARNCHRSTFRCILSRVFLAVYFSREWIHLVLVVRLAICQSIALRYRHSMMSILVVHADVLLSRQLLQLKDARWLFALLQYEWLFNYVNVFYLSWLGKLRQLFLGSHALINSGVAMFTLTNHFIVISLRLFLYSFDLLGMYEFTWCFL